MKDNGPAWPLCMKVHVDVYTDTGPMVSETSWPRWSSYKHSPGYVRNEEGICG